MINFFRYYLWWRVFWREYTRDYAEALTYACVQANIAVWHFDQRFLMGK